MWGRTDVRDIWHFLTPKLTGRYYNFYNQIIWMLSIFKSLLTFQGKLETDCEDRVLPAALSF